MPCVHEFLLQMGKKMQVRDIVLSYENGNSITEIAALANLPTRKVREVLCVNNVKIRSHKDASYLKKNKSGDPFDILASLTIEEDHLKAMALGLYLTEGNTKNKNSVRFTNSNPALVKIFVKFLKVICGVENEKIKFSLIVYPDVSINKAKKYWIEFLSVTAGQFMKTTVLENRNGSCKKHSEYGTITVYVHNTKLLGIIKDWAKEYAHVAQLVEHIHGKDGVVGSTPTVGSAIAGLPNGSQGG